MNKQRYKYLLFDADGTLFDFSRAESDALRHAFRAGDLDCGGTVCALYSEINESLWKEHEQGLVSKDELKILRFSRLFSQLGIDRDPAGFAREYLLQLGRCGYLYDGAVEVCRDLAAEHDLALITNGIASVQHPRFINSPLASIIPRMFVSEEIGWQKPQIGFFNHVLAELAIGDKSQVLVIGDSLSADIQGGINAGLDTCWYNPGKAEISGDIVPDYEIDDLKSLYTIVNL